MTETAPTHSATFTIAVVDQRSGAVIEGEAAQQNAVEAATAYIRATCDVDGTLVTSAFVGTSQYAHCQRGHRWQYTFNPAGPGWITR